MMCGRPCDGGRNSDSKCSDSNLPVICLVLGERRPPRSVPAIHVGTDTSSYGRSCFNALGKMLFVISAEDRRWTDVKASLAGHRCGSCGLRFALPNARILVHQPKGGFEGQATDIMLHAQEILNLK